MLRMAPPEMGRAAVRHGNRRVVQKPWRQLGHVMLFDPEVVGGQYAAGDDGVRRNGHRGGADDSHRHIEMPRGRPLAANFHENAVVHMRCRSNTGFGRARTSSQLNVRRDGSDQEALFIRQGG